MNDETAPVLSAADLILARRPSLRVAPTIQQAAEPEPVGVPDPTAREQASQAQGAGSPQAEE